MLPYLILTAGTAITGKLASFQGKRVHWWLVSAGFLILFSGLRYQVGSDYETYGLLFQNITPESFSDSLAQTPQEAGFVALMYLVRQFTSDFAVLLTLCAFLTVVPIMMVIWRTSPMPTLSLFLYIALGYYPTSLNAVRQSIAVSLILLGETYREKNRSLWILLSITAALFHTSAIIATILLFLSRRIKLPLHIYLFSILGLSFAATALFTTIFSKEALGGLNQNYSNYLAESDGSGIGTLLALGFHIAIAGFCIIALRKQGVRTTTEMPNCTYYMLSITPLFLASIAREIGRLELYFGIFAILLIPQVIHRLRHKDLWAFAVATISFVYFLFHISFYGNLLPYLSVLGID